MWVHIGSNNEDDNIAGISHFIEHMLFKGTKKYKVGDIAREIEKLGGYLNAFTSYEATAYQINVPEENFSKSLDILIDVLQNSSFEPIEIEKEAQVIIEECKMRDDTPQVYSWENLMKTAFTKHHYGRSIIGKEEVIQKLTRDDLLTFVCNYYIPKNMNLIITGDIKPEDVIEKIKNFSLPEPPEKGIYLSPKEPQQKELRFSHIKGDIERTYIDIGFHVPDQLHSDSFSLEILSSILGEGRSSRLYQELKEKKRLVTSIDAGELNGRDPGLFIISSVTDADKIIDTIKTIWNEIEKIKNCPIEEEELKKTKTSLEHNYLFNLETVDGQADKIGHYASLGDYTMSVKYLDFLKEITAEDVKSVANKYFKIDNCSISIYSPKKTKIKNIKNLTREGLGKLLSPDKKTAKKKKFSYPAEIKIKKNKMPPEKIILNNGITFISEVDRTLPVASFYAGFKGGVRFEEQEKNGLCRFMTRLFIKGTKNRSASNIAKDIESLGSFLSPRAGKDSFGLSMSILEKYAEQGLEIFFDVLGNPSFLPEEMEKERSFILAEIREKKDEPIRCCLELCDSLIFNSHPYGMTVSGTEETVNKIKEKDIKNFYKKYVQSKNLYFSAVGDIDPHRIGTLLEKWFTKKSSQNIMDFPSPPPEIAPEEKKIAIQEKDIKQASISIGFLAPHILSEDYYNFIILNSILNGMGSRLFIELRDIKGLAYVVFCYLDPGVGTGSFKTYIGTSPHLEKESTEGMLYELNKIKEQGVTEEEVEKAKNVIKGRYQINLQERSYRAGKYSIYEIMGPGYERLLRLPKNLEQVTVEGVNKTAQKYFELEKYSLSVIRPKGQ